jgi:hypothetical protein
MAENILKSAFFSSFFYPWIRIRIPNPDPQNQWIRILSGSTTLLHTFASKEIEIAAIRNENRVGPRMLRVRQPCPFPVDRKKRITQHQCFGSGSEPGSAWDPYSMSSWIRIRIAKADPDPEGRKWAPKKKKYEVLRAEKIIKFSIFYAVII